MLDTRLRSPVVVCGLLALAAGAVALLLQGTAPAQEPRPASVAALTTADWPLSPSETRGRVVYRDYCLGCHGAEGRGDGPASRFLDPLPRDFQSGKFKFRSTAFGQPPLEADLLRTVTCGLPGSSMPGFPLVPEIERKDAVRFVLYLSQLGRANRLFAIANREDGTSLEQFRADRLPALRREVEAEFAALRRISVAPEPAADAASVERGRALFATTCASCHGTGGVGDGPSASALRDDRSAVIRPRDFTTGSSARGARPRTCSSA